MAKEIERKFLVKDESFKRLAVKSERITQAYLSADPDAVVRLRIIDSRGFLTVKSRTIGHVRDEWEYDIPVDDIHEMLQRCRLEGNIIMKTRYYVPYNNFMWEVDVFEGALAPLVLAEVELPVADAEFELPPFAGEDVTGDPRYYNSTLSFGSF